MSQAQLRSISGGRSRFQKTTDVVANKINPWLVFASASITILTFTASVVQARAARQAARRK